MKKERLDGLIKDGKTPTDQGRFTLSPFTDTDAKEALAERRSEDKRLPLKLEAMEKVYKVLLMLDYHEKQRVLRAAAILSGVEL